MTVPSDPITLEIIKNALSSIADEMALVILRSAYSPIVRDSMDYSSAVCDHAGEVIAQGLTNPVHLGSFPDVMKNIVTSHSAAMKEGDLFIINDPYGSGGMHLPDVYLIKPVFMDGTVEGFAATVVHHADVGGMAPGSMALQASEIYQEGLRLPIVKLFEAGKLNTALVRVMEANSRTPIELQGDLQAQIAACSACEKALLNLIGKYGKNNFRRYIVALHNYAEKLIRQEIEKMPDGEYYHEDFIDGLGDNPEPIKFCVKLTIEGSNLSVDWTGTSKQVKGAINGPVAITNSVAFMSIRAAVDTDIPNCSGYMRPIKIIAPRGTLVNPEAPAACAARGVIAYRMLDTILGALNKVVPGQIPAMGEGGPSVISLSGWNKDKAWLITDGILGSWGGRRTLDGVEGIANLGANLSNQPIELVEARLPVKILEYGFAKNSGGAGTNRGGLAMLRSYELLANGTLTLRSDRRDHLPSGCFGGLPGSPSVSYLNINGQNNMLSTMPMETIVVSKGSSLTHIAAGGAGYGNPLERSPSRVLEDVIDERIDRDFAEKIYGVIVEDNSINEIATQALRSQMAGASESALAEKQLTLFLAENSAEQV